MKFYAGPKFLFSNMMNCHTFNVDIIMNTIRTITNINHVSIGSIFIEMTYEMKFYAGQQYLLVPWHIQQNLFSILIFYVI